MQAEMSTADYALYSRIGVAYMDRRAKGTAMVAAWDATIGETAAQEGLGRKALMSRSNKMGKSFRERIKACRRG